MRKRYRRRSHAVSMLHAHIITCTKYRRKVITRRTFDLLKRSMRQTARALGIEIIAIESDRDHLHLMIEYPPTHALGEIVRRLKGASSRAVRKMRLPEITSKLWGGAFWSPSYCTISCGGAPLDVVKSYVEAQNTPQHIAKRKRNDAKRHTNGKSDRSLDPRTEVRGLRE